MHDILRQRLMRKIESLPEEQVYQILDYIEFLESKYGSDLQAEASGLQRFAEAMEDKLRKKAMSPATLREAFQLISAADRVLSNVSTAGKQLMEEFTAGTTADSTADTTAGSGERPSAAQDSLKGLPVEPGEGDGETSEQEG